MWKKRDTLINQGKFRQKKNGFVQNADLWLTVTKMPAPLVQRCLQA